MTSRKEIRETLTEREKSEKKHDKQRELQRIMTGRWNSAKNMTDRGKSEKACQTEGNPKTMTGRGKSKVRKCILTFPRILSYKSYRGDHFKR